MILVPTLKPINTTDKVKYSSSKPSVCKVNASGKLTAVSAGKATITAKSSGGIKKKCTVTVKAAKRLTSIALDKASLSVGNNENSVVNDKD